jgi:DNA-binding MarR family transcriptional regulator
MMARGDGRGKVIAAIREDPYVSYRDVAKTTGLALATVQHHVERLIEQGMLTRTDCPACHRPGRYKLVRNVA